MLLSFVLAAVVAFTASMSANGAEDGCPFFCQHSRQCKGCGDQAHCLLFLCASWTGCRAAFHLIKWPLFGFERAGFPVTPYLFQDSYDYLQIDRPEFQKST
ncbi:uncharacterized protein EDB93DRAFT_1115172 [Suillus bovinus]|uniref:uncharacterized protein n=1 Tax=Suillus bovinus TaxID=48563 RepID=UPI001B882782|nr:uncharacterized protein EDB93DRAFT_1115172 [Suillus bovinus]KAG2159344.1 hypothetical protein EDB93DRAFT_1115172 [Suillus bovinus]